MLFVSFLHDNGKSRTEGKFDTCLSRRKFFCHGKLFFLAIPKCSRADDNDSSRSRGKVVNFVELTYLVYSVFISKFVSFKWQVCFILAVNFQYSLLS
jgi:hypothetical protein